MATVDQDVVGEVEFLETLESAQERGLQQKPIVRLALHDVSKAHELRMTADRFENGADVWRSQVDPSDDAGDERMRISEREKPARLFERLTRLDGDAGVEAGARQLAL